MCEISAKNNPTQKINVSDIDADLAEFTWTYHMGGFRNGQIGTLHRVIMQRVLGRKLLPIECIGYKDQNRLNCQRDNLYLTTREEVIRQFYASRNRAYPQYASDIIKINKSTWQVIKDNRIFSTEHEAVQHIQTGVL